MKGHLSIKIGGIIYKFCGGCADRLRGDKAERIRHCNRNHEGEQFDFLKLNEWPKDCKWKNFMDYRSDPTIELIA